MPKSVTQYSLLISCPGDIQDEVGIIEECVQRFNDMYSDTLGITVITKYWKKNSYPQSGDKPQVILNQQYVNDCDAAVALFWTRFGTPTDKYGSGTEEEISIMLESDKQVFMYFSDKPISPSQQNSSEYERIKAFKEKYKGKGLYFGYNSNEEFAKMFFAHLTQYFIFQNRIEEIKSENYSQLRLVGINEHGKIEEKASIYPFVLNTDKSIKTFQEKIIALYKQISDIHLGERKTSQQMGLNFSEPVNIEKEEKELIDEYAKVVKISITSEFFQLGNLRKDTLLYNPLGGIKLQGTDKEKEKYWLIIKLHKTIQAFLEWAPVESGFSGLNCIRLAVQNNGKAVDEDVEITMQFPINSFIDINQFPDISSCSKEYMLTDCDIKKLFGIDSTAEYLEYTDSDLYSYVPTSTGLPGFDPDYDKEYIKAMRNVFSYSIYKEGDKCIVKLNVKYIKHNTTVAYPTIILIKNLMEEIPYTITSKYNPEMVKSSIEIKH